MSLRFSRSHNGVVNEADITHLEDQFNGGLVRRPIKDNL